MYLDKYKVVQDNRPFLNFFFLNKKNQEEEEEKKKKKEIDKMEIISWG